MRVQTSHWTVAVVLSVVIHGGAAVWFTSHAGDVMIAGGASVEVALLGNAQMDSVSAGHAAAALQPVTAEATPIQPVTTQALQATPVEPQRPTETVAAAKPLAEQAKPVETAVRAAAEPVPVETVTAPDAEIAKPAESDSVEASTPAEPVKAVESPPVPTPRPERAAEAPKPQPVQPKPKEKPKQKPAQRADNAGSGGKGGPDARRGTADGEPAGRTQATGKTGPAREAGNAAVSNYPGQVVSRLRRSLRYPAAARRRHLRGEVRVSFTVSSSGSVSAISLAASSGHPVLDQAALETVRRAAPFLPIPASAGRSSWSFTVPLAFTR